MNFSGADMLLATKQVRMSKRENQNSGKSILHFLGVVIQYFSKNIAGSVLKVKSICLFPRSEDA